MVERATLRLTWISSLFLLPALVILSWWAWLGLNDDVKGERHRIARFEELAAYHVVNNVGFELFHLHFSFSLGLRKEVQKGTTDWRLPVAVLREEYRGQAHYPDLLKDLALVTESAEGGRRWLTLSDGAWVAGAPPPWLGATTSVFDVAVDPVLNLQAPVMVYSLPPQGQVRQALVLRYDTGVLLKTIVPELIRRSFDDPLERRSYQVDVVESHADRPPAGAPSDLLVPLVPPVRFTDWLRNYLDRSVLPALEPPIGPASLGSPPVLPESGFRALSIRLAPLGLEAYLRGLELRNLAAAVTLLVVLLGLYLAFLWSVLRILQASRRERTFSTLVSHELKTPLAALHSLSENLAAGVTKSPDRVKEYGLALLDQTGRLSEMVGNILTLAQLESPQSRWQGEAFDAAQLLNETAEHFGLAPVTAEGAWMVQGNRVAVSAALDNLVTNALRYGAKPGETPQVSLGLERSGGRGTRWIGLRVADRGPGLAPGEEGAVFQSFRRGRHTALSQVPGSGVGLSLVRATMKHLNGRIQMAAVAGGGLSLTLWFKEKVGT